MYVNIVNIVSLIRPTKQNFLELFIENICQRMYLFPFIYNFLFYKFIFIFIIFYTGIINLFSLAILF